MSYKDVIPISIKVEETPLFWNVMKQKICDSDELL